MKKFTGQLGIVLIPSETIRKNAQIMALKIDFNFIHFTKSKLPHITLYHSKLKDVPEDYIKNILKKITEKLSLVKLNFGPIDVYGGHFIFWNIKRTKELKQIHNFSLSLSRYFVVKGKQQADKEKIKISKKEQNNVRKYGHPLVRDLWKPHVTLGYSKKPRMSQEKCEISGEIDSVAFVRVGDYGTIKNIIFRERISR